MKYQPLAMLGADIQYKWQAWLNKVQPAEASAYRLVAIRQTERSGFQAQKVIVQVLDENGFPIPNLPIAFAYSTADQYTLSPEFKWTPPPPHRAFIVPTEGGGQIDQVQGSPVKEGEPGGITVYVFDPELPSDVVTGLGMLADHTGLFLIFQRRLEGVLSLDERVAGLEEKVKALEVLNLPLK